MENLSNWQIAEYVAWGLSALLLMWMLFDAVRVSAQYSEDVLLSSREGVDELLEHGDVPEAENGGHQQ